MNKSAVLDSLHFKISDEAIPTPSTSAVGETSPKREKARTLPLPQATSPQHFIRNPEVSAQYCTSFGLKAYVRAIATQIYRRLLFRMPSFYFHRVSQFLLEVDFSLHELDQLSGGGLNLPPRGIWS
ncbi:hypothetical protein CPB86DRAFT_97430 [Serendipita vermifera]|nr:hypothetical protein CPB86DRAFT_97430 [Serendipita vermifera]